MIITTFVRYNLLLLKAS